MFKVPQPLPHPPVPLPSIFPNFYSLHLSDVSEVTAIEVEFLVAKCRMGLHCRLGLNFWVSNPPITVCLFLVTWHRWALTTKGFIMSITQYLTARFLEDSTPPGDVIRGLVLSRSCPKINESRYKIFDLFTRLIECKALVDCIRSLNFNLKRKMCMGIFFYILFSIFVFEKKNL